MAIYIAVELQDFKNHLYSYSDGLMLGTIVINSICVMLSFTTFKYHAVAYSYASATVFFLARSVGAWKLGSWGTGSVTSDDPTGTDVYEYGVNNLGLCWVSSNQDGYNFPMWAGFYIPVAFVQVVGFLASGLAHTVSLQSKESRLSSLTESCELLLSFSGVDAL